MIKLHDLIEQLDQLAPLSCAEPWDKVGLHLGDPGQSISAGLLCIDLTPAVVVEAVRCQANLILAYHPPIFSPLTHLRTGSASDWKQRCLIEAIKHDLAVYSPHTALDATADGLNDWLARGAGTGDVVPIEPTSLPSSCQGPGVCARHYEIVVFIPKEDADAFRTKLTDAGAGVIGDYVECTFNVPGQGTFRGLEGTHPTIGTQGQFERVDELRMETIVPAERLSDLVAMIHREHPYEEPAYFVFPLANPRKPGDPVTGQGRLLTLSEPATLDQVVQRMAEHLASNVLRVARAVDDVGQPIDSGKATLGKVAVCAGAGGSVLTQGKAKQADVLITGEMRHHDLLDAQQRGQSVILAGHTWTERPFLPELARRLNQRTGNQVTWSVSEQDRCPWQPLRS